MEAHNVFWFIAFMFLMLVTLIPFAIIWWALGVSKEIDMNCQPGCTNHPWDMPPLPLKDDEPPILRGE